MIQPLGDRVVVRPAPEETESEAGILRPDIGVEKPVHGIVVAVGEGHWDHVHFQSMARGFGEPAEHIVKPRPMMVKVGDHVLYGKYSGSEVDIDGDKVLFMREDEILGILPAEAKVALP